MDEVVKVTLTIDKKRYLKLKGAAYKMGYSVPALLKLCLVNSWLWFINILDDAGLDSKGIDDVWKN